MENSYIMVSLDDEKAKHLADVMGNKTCKKILGLLAEKEMSESDLAKKLNIPLNTVEYNLKKLIDAGLAEKTKSFFWSVKGKKIPNYKLSNKYIIIAPKNSALSGLKTLLPVFAILGLSTLAINYFTRTPTANYARSSQDLFAAAPKAMNYGAESFQSANSGFLTGFLSTPWAIFLAGGLLVLASYFIFKKIMKGGKP